MVQHNISVFNDRIYARPLYQFLNVGMVEVETPAIHKKWIERGKMTEEESQRMVEDWNKANAENDAMEEEEIDDKYYPYPV